jgi:hypothetical protein
LTLDNLLGSPRSRAGMFGYGIRAALYFHCTLISFRGEEPCVFAWRKVERQEALSTGWSASYEILNPILKEEALMA